MDSVDSAVAFGTSAAFGSIDADVGIWVRAPSCNFSQDGNSPRCSFSCLGSFSTTQDCVDADLGTSTAVGWACLLQPTDKKATTAKPLRSNVPATLFLSLERIPNGTSQRSQIE